MGLGCCDSILARARPGGNARRVAAGLPAGPGRAEPEDGRIGDAAGRPAAVGLVLAATALIGFIDSLMRPASATGGLWQLHRLRGLLALAVALYGTGNFATRRLCAEEATPTLLAGFFEMPTLWGTLGCAVLAVHLVPAPSGAEGFALRGWTARRGVPQRGRGPGLRLDPRRGERGARLPDRVA